MTDPVKKPRKNRTPQEKAQELLDQAKSRHERAKAASNSADKTYVDARVAQERAHAEVKAAEAAVDYAKRHPDLAIAQSALADPPNS